MTIPLRRIGPLMVLACVIASAGSVHARSPQSVTPTPEQRAHALVDLLVKQDFATVTAGFDATMKAAVTDDQLRAGWTSTTQQAGMFRRQAGTKLDARGALQIVVVTCEFERSSIDIQVVYNAAGLVAGLSMRPKKSKDQRSRRSSSRNYGQ